MVGLPGTISILNSILTFGTICSRIFFWNNVSPISSSIWEPGKKSKRLIQKSEYVFSLLSSKWRKMMVQFTATKKSPQDPCKEYSPTFGWYVWLNVGKYTSRNGSPMGSGSLPFNERQLYKAIVLPIVGLYCWGGMPYAPWNMKISSSPTTKNMELEELDPLMLA